jgi:hypothetical protein
MGKENKERERLRRVVSQARQGRASARVLGKSARVWKAASSKADPTQKQDWILKCLQGGRAHPLAAWEVATLCFSPHGAGNRNPSRVVVAGDGVPRPTAPRPAASSILSCADAADADTAPLPAPLERATQEGSGWGWRGRTPCRG